MTQKDYAKYLFAAVLMDLRIKTNLSTKNFSKGLDPRITYATYRMIEAGSNLMQPSYAIVVVDFLQKNQIKVDYSNFCELLISIHAISDSKSLSDVPSLLSNQNVLFDKLLRNISNLTEIEDASDSDYVKEIYGERYHLDALNFVLGSEGDDKIIANKTRYSESDLIRLYNIFEKTPSIYFNTILELNYTIQRFPNLYDGSTSREWEIMNHKDFISFDGIFNSQTINEIANEEFPYTYLKNINDKKSRYLVLDKQKKGKTYKKEIVERLIMLSGFGKKDKDLLNDKIQVKSLVDFKYENISNLKLLYSRIPNPLGIWMYGLNRTYESFVGFVREKHKNELLQLINCESLSYSNIYLVKQIMDEVFND